VQANTFFELFRAAGWRTALIGKSHLQNFSGQNALVDRRNVPNGYVAAPAGLDEAEKNDRADAIYEQENPKRWADDPRHEIHLPYYGFDHVELCTGHATRVRGSYARWLAERHSNPEVLRGPENALPGSAYSLPQAWRTRLPEELYPTTYVAERTIAYLEDHAAQHSSAPFFLQCSFPDPHHPFTPPGRYWDLYKPGDVTLPESFRIGNRKLPPHVAALHAERDAGTRKAEAQAAFAVTEQEAREAIALTYGMITMIDDAMARILNRLDALGLADNTVIVFTSDHGDMMGDHQLLLKGALAYRGLTRVPFIWVEPTGTRAGSRTNALYGTIDIGATFLDRARLAPFNGMQGASMLQTLTGNNESGCDGILIEYGSQRPLPGVSVETTMRTLVDQRGRITFYGGAPWGELYDLQADPHEMHNLWDDPGAITLKQEMTERLVQKMIAMAERSPQPSHRA